MGILALSQGAMAHENHVYRIGDKTYQFTVGSLNEPVTVDDKTGLDFKVAMPGAKPGAEGTPVTGLDQTLKVELAAAGKKKVFNIQPSFGTPGSYKTSFFPTVQTTLTYRIFGTVENIPVDLTFTCNPAGHPRSPDDNTEVKISDQVSQLSKRGSFGCPLAKADAGFPEPAPTAFELQTRVSTLDSAVTEARAEASRARSFALMGMAAGLIGIIVGGVAWMNAKKKDHVPESTRRSASAVR